VRIPPLPPAEAGTRFSDPGGMQGWVDLCVGGSVIMQGHTARECVVTYNYCAMCSPPLPPFPSPFLSHTLCQRENIMYCVNRQP